MRRRNGGVSRWRCPPYPTPRSLAAPTPPSPSSNPMTPPAPATPGAAALAISVVDGDRLQRAIGTLPIDQRAVMVVHYYLDQPLSKAAEILDIPVGTAKSRLHHGLTTLRRSMRDEREAAPQPVRERTA